MNKYPLVSIIVLTYNNFLRINETLISVLRQDYPNFELIVADDHSSVFPEKQIQELIESQRTSFLSNYKILINETNLGTVKNLNRGIKECNGEYIFCFGANDLFINEHSVKQVVDVFLTYNCDVTFTSRVVYHQNRFYEVLPHVSDWPKIAKMNTRDSMYKALLLTEHYDVFIGVNMVFKKSTIVKHNYFDEHYVLFEDLPMIEKMVWEDNVKLCPDIITMIYDGKTGVSAKGNINPKLAKDVTYYNRFGKLTHYNELDSKTKKHVDFGIKRAATTNKFKLFLLCLQYSPRIISHLHYLFQRNIARHNDKKIINELKFSDYSDFITMCT